MKAVESEMKRRAIKPNMQNLESYKIENGKFGKL